MQVVLDWFVALDERPTERAFPKASCTSMLRHPPTGPGQPDLLLVGSTVEWLSPRVHFQFVVFKNLNFELQPKAS
jgi:hypothetical protein